MKTYRGIVRLRPSDIILDAGGVEVKLLGSREVFAARDGQVTAVSGKQRGDEIHDAQLAPVAEAARAESVDVFAPVVAAIRRHQQQLKTLDGVIGVRPGFQLAHNEGGETPAIIVLTRPGAKVARLPTAFDGIPVEVRPASPREIVEGPIPLNVWEGVQEESAEAAPQIGYRPPASSVVELAEAQVSNITCHVGPDAGWPLLKPFLQGTNDHLTVAMYQFYAEHIMSLVHELGENPALSLNIILQTGASGNDPDIESKLRETWGDRLKFTPASVSGPDRIFNNSYHTKVAVRDHTAFWLSSGNWSPHSQPVVTASAGPNLYRLGNREWHVIIEDQALALMYEKFIEYDVEQARSVRAPEAAPALPDLLLPMAVMEAESVVQQDHPFAPRTFATGGQTVRVQPLMSPDNYAASIRDLIRSARHTLYLQFSYIRQPSREIFDEIVTAISEKMADPDMDVRVLVSSNQTPEHSDLLVGQRGWKRNMFHRQSSPMHNKGVLVDGNIAVVGSNNWSSDGTQYNRDTSLIFYSREIAQYYTEMFLFDWDNLSKPATSAPEIVPELAPETGPTPLGKVRIPWQAWYEG